MKEPAAMTPLQGLAFGLLQGFTEILPISSSAHLVLLPWFLGWTDPGLGFDVALHGGTLIAIVGYFWREWWALLRGAAGSLVGGSPGPNPQAALFWKLLVASLPGALAGVALAGPAESVFRDPRLIAATLAGFGLLLGWADRRPESRRSLEDIGWVDAIAIGLAQAIAIVPGVSRSGVTIAAARVLGLERETAARFSFLLAAPIVAGAVAMEIRSVAAVWGDGGQFAAFFASAVCGLAAVGGLLRVVRSWSYRPFVIYRLVLAGAILAASC
jgi:undecaprenyl-diphosphatase